ncbi:FAD-binding oxidoreductase [Streptomyces gamaensis]|uniref:FAD-binding oxidoreductase n=1 Tax=Streptomyces gamaensis TaxID=1763542 RepID=A0ABW0ZBZ7_9ACTN
MNTVSPPGTSAAAPLAPADVEELRSQVAGPVLLPGQDGFAEEHTGFELSVEHRPLVIVCATGAADVIAAVRFAAARGLPVAVQATGHGKSAPATGVLVGTRRMTGVRVDPEARTARIEAGVRWERVIHEAAAHGLAPLSGSAPFVGAVSYTLGGGLGLLSRAYGNACDRVTSLDLVTADGTFLQVSAERHPDLFWGVRGSKGNLGVVTSVEVELVPVRELHGGGLYFDADSTRDVLTAYLEWTDRVPEELASSVFLAAYPDAEGIPGPLRGRFVTHVRLAHLGERAEAERWFDELRAAGTVLMDTVTTLPYTRAGEIHSDPPSPVASYSKTVMLRRPDAEAVDAILRLAGPGTDAVFGVELRHMGGALSRPAKTPSAAGHYPEAVFNAYVGSLLEPGQRDAIDAAQREMLDALRPWTVPGVALNFLAGHNTSVEVTRGAYTPENYARLRELKRRYDPDNVFRSNPNIPPASA